MKFLLKFILVGITLFLVSFVTLYLFTGGDYIVRDTVTSDSSLQSLEINEHKIHIESYGDTTMPMLVVLHGGPGYDSKYMETFKGLSDNFHVILYDQLGCGLSERVLPEEISIEKQIETLNEIIQYYNNDTAYLLGHSWGAMLATAFTANYTNKINKLILIEPEYLTKETSDIFFKATNYMRPKFSYQSLSFLIKHWFRSLHISEPDKQASTDYLMGSYNSHVNSSWHPIRGGFCIQEDKTLEINRFGATASASLVTSIFDNEGNFRNEIFENAKNYENEVLILAGECNKINGNAIQQRHQEFFKNATLKIIPNAGFFVHLDKPKETINITRKFLSH